MSATEPRLPFAAWLEADPRYKSLEVACKGDRARAAAAYGNELFQAGELDRAAEVLGSAVALEPDSALYWGNHGVVLAALGERERAIVQMDRSLELDPSQAQMWLNLGNTLTTLGRTTQAEAAFRRAAQDKVTQAEAQTSLGLLRMSQFDYAGAIDCFCEAVEAGSTNALLHANLGKAYFQLGELKEALIAYGEAARLAPGVAGYAENLAFLAMLEGVIDGRAEAAVTAYAKPIVDDAVFLSALRRALLFLTSFDRVDAALALIKEWLEYYPDDVEPRYMQAVLSGRNLKRAPKSYITTHFDRMAGQFDDRFLASLEYRVPEKMRQLLERELGQGWRGHILDAGCGTGIMGAALKDMAKSLTGIDLSPNMIEQARKRGVYDTLEAADLIDYLDSKPAAFDLIVAADCLIYTGALEPALGAAARALKRGGLVVFDVEAADGASYAMTRTGRFTHPDAYVRRAAKSHFRLLESLETDLRHEATKVISGNIYLMRKSDPR